MKYSKLPTYLTIKAAWQDFCIKLNYSIMHYIINDNYKLANKFYPVESPTTDIIDFFRKYEC